MPTLLAGLSGARTPPFLRRPQAGGTGARRQRFAFLVVGNDAGSTLAPRTSLVNEVDGCGEESQGTTSARPTREFRAPLSISEWTELAAPLASCQMDWSFFEQENLNWVSIRYRSARRAKSSKPRWMEIWQ